MNSYQNSTLQHNIAIKRACRMIELYDGICRDLMDEGMSLENVPIEIMEGAADESLFLMGQYQELAQRYHNLLQEKRVK